MELQHSVMGLRIVYRITVRAFRVMGLGLWIYELLRGLGSVFRVRC